MCLCFRKRERVRERKRERERGGGERVREREREREHTHCTLDTLIIEQYNPGEREGKNIIYTKHLPTRGQSFIHPTLAREDMFSTEPMRGSAIRGYAVSHTLGTYILFLFSSSQEVKGQ